MTTRSLLASGLGASLALGLLVSGCEEIDPPPSSAFLVTAETMCNPSSSYTDGYPWPARAKSPCWKKCGPTVGSSDVSPGLKWCVGDSTLGSKGAGNVSCGKCMWPDWKTGIQPWDGQKSGLVGLHCFDPSRYSSAVPPVCPEGVGKGTGCTNKCGGVDGDFCLTVIKDSSDVSKWSACTCTSTGWFACGSWSGVGWM